MNNRPLNNPQARYWVDLVEELDFTEQEKREIRDGADQIIAEVRARRLAEVRAGGSVDAAGSGTPRPYRGGDRGRGIR